MSDNTEDAGDRGPVVDTAKFAVAAIGVIVATAGLIGGFTGGIARVARNGPWQLPLVVLLVFVAALLALRATLLPPAPQKAAIPPAAGTAPSDAGAPVSDQPSAHPHRHGGFIRRLIFDVRSRLLVASLVTFAVAAVFVTYALSQSLARPDRPVISSEWVNAGGGWALKGSVSASGLKTTDKLTVVINRLVVTGNATPQAPTAMVGQDSAPPFSAPPHYAYYAGTVYKQVVGADLDGVAKISFQVPLPNTYGGLQVVANLGNAKECPFTDEELEHVVLACLTLDAPTWPAATSSK
jgi:hypothetical protein